MSPFQPNPQCPKPKDPEKRPLTPTPPTHQTPAKLKQIQYRSYQATIQIYHFRADYMSVSTFRNLLNRHKDGYIDKLVSTDTLRTEQFIPTGDELPAGCIEVAYLPSVFPKTSATTSGSALGFRMPNNIIEWLCFDRLIETSLLECWVCDRSTRAVRAKQKSDESNEVRLFDLVGFLGKGMERRRVRGGNKEHKLWHDGLWAARRRTVRLRLTWRNYKAECREWREERRVEGERARGEGVGWEESDEMDEEEGGSDEDVGQCQQEEEEGIEGCLGWGQHDDRKESVDEPEDDTMDDLSD
jgi:hypothetical protein